MRGTVIVARSGLLYNINIILDLSSSAIIVAALEISRGADMYFMYCLW